MNIHLYSHGAYSQHTHNSGWDNYIVIESTGEILEDKGLITGSFNHILAELTAVTRGIQTISKHITKEELLKSTIYIYASYEGVEKWAMLQWKAKSNIANKYIDFIEGLVAKGWKFKFQTLTKAKRKRHSKFTLVVENSKSVADNSKPSIVKPWKKQPTKNVKQRYLPKGAPVMLPKGQQIDTAVSKIANNGTNKNSSNKNRGKRKKKNKSKIKQTSKKSGKGEIIHNPDIFIT